MRTFISLELPEEVKAELFKTFNSLKNSGLVSGNFVEKENIHLTLKFLGNISEEKLIEIEKALLGIDFSSFNASTGEIGFFPSEKYIKILWANLVSDKILLLKKLIDEKLSVLGISLDNKEFSSHITLARIKNVKDRNKFLEKLKELKIKKMDFDVKMFSLIKSELRSSGPVYKIIKQFNLK